MTKTITYTTELEYWKLKAELKAQGYKMISDCYWYQDFEKDGEIITLEQL